MHDIGFLKLSIILWENISQFLHAQTPHRHDIRYFKQYAWGEEHALFVGYAPFSDPKFVTSVLVEHGGSGAKAAACCARYPPDGAKVGDGV